MHIVRDASEDEMILAFVQAEVYSPRFGECMKRALGDKSLVYGNDLTDPAVNARRRTALAACRGYRRGIALFTGFPEDVAWKLEATSIGELGEFRYADYITWNTLSGGTRLLRDGAANTETVQVSEGGDSINEGILAVERELRHGQRYPPVIAVAEAEGAPHVLVEGHTRATAFVRAFAPS